MLGKFAFLGSLLSLLIALCSILVYGREYANPGDFGNRHPFKCEVDDCFRDLKRFKASASHFCSDYISKPTAGPAKASHSKPALPSYVSQYGASRVSSACTCLILVPQTSTTTSRGAYVSLS